MKKEYFVAASVDVYRNIQLAEDSNTQFQSVLRDDNSTITTSEGSNIQDGTIIHVDEGAPTIVDKYATVGRQCMLHGRKIGDGTLISMGLTILDNATVGENGLIGADSLVTGGRIIPPNVLAFGQPAKVTRLLTVTEIASNHASALHYVQRAEEFRQQKYPKLAQNWEEDDEEN